MFVSGEKLFLGAALRTKAERSRILGGICSATQCYHTAAVYSLIVPQ